MEGFKMTKLDEEKRSNALAYGGFDLCKLPYTKDDAFVEKSQKQLEYDTYEYVPFLTYQNDVLDSIFLITSNSPTVSGIIAQKTAYTIGGGLLAVPSSVLNPLPLARQIRATELNEDDVLALNDYLVEVNPQGQSMLDVIEDAADNLWSFGNAFIEVCIINRKLRFRVLSPFMCRPKKADDGELYPSKVGVSKEWQDFGSTNYNITEYPLFPNFGDVDGSTKSILHIKFDKPNFYYWGSPDWISAKIWGELEYRMAKYNQGKFENGFTPSAIISAYGFTNSDEASDFVDSMKSCFTGTSNNSKMFIQALRDETSKMDVQVLNNESQGEFISLAQLAREEIITASRWSPALAGLSTAGQLGSNQQIRSEFDKAFTTVIRPVQNKIMRSINAVFRKALQLDEDIEGLSKDIALDLSKMMPVTFAGDIEPETICTINELRDDIGKPPLDGGDIIANSKTQNDGNRNAN